MYVGGDAYIAPWGTNEFALDFHKNGLYRRVDVGIDPYKLPRGCPKNRRGGRGFPPCELHNRNAKICGEFVTSLGRAESPAPTQYGNSVFAIDGLDEADNAAICTVDGVIRGVFGEQPDFSLFAAEALDGCGVIEKRDHDLSVFGC